MIYMDYNASCPIRLEALQAMIEAYATWGNPSSIHRFGRAKGDQLENARTQMAQLIGAEGHTLIVTSGGSESNTLALSGCQKFVNSRITSTIEHDSVLNNCAQNLTQEGETHRMVRVTSEGIIDLAHLEEILSQSAKPALVSIMLANNETGVIQPIQEVAHLAKAHDALVHTDASQAFGKIPVSFVDLGVDMMTVSGHKIGGPLGVGALILKSNIKFEPLIRGGLQEKGLRAGTENIPAFLGFLAAAEAALRDDMIFLAGLRNHLEKTLESEVTNFKIYGKNAPRLPNTSCFSTLSLTQESQLMALDLEGIAVSAGAACASKKMRASHVLLAMGSTLDEAKCALRVSLGHQTKPADIDALTQTWLNLYFRVHRRLHENTPLTRTATC